MSLRLALFEPDIPQNTAAVLRTSACLGIGSDIIGPCGFIWGDKRMRRAGLDYLSIAQVVKHDSWGVFKEQSSDRRLILLTTKSDKSFLNFQFEEHDTLILGRESSGVPNEIHENVDFRVTIPMKCGARSLNLAIAAAIASSEALRQLGSFVSTNTVGM